MRDSRDDMTGDGENVDAKAALLADTANPLDVLRALRPGSLPEDAYQAVRAWAAAVCEMPEVERVTQTLLARRLLRKHGISSAKTLLDAAIREAEEKAGLEEPATIVESAGAARPNPAPWPDPVDGAKLLDRIEKIFRRYVVVEEYAYPVLTVWVAFTYVFECFDVCPLLFLRSPLMRCGKTTLLDGLHCLVSKPLGTSNITAAGMYRAIDADKPTFLIDELDSAGRERSEIRNILDAGHQGKEFAQRLLPESPRRDWQPSFNHRRPRFRDPDETEGPEGFHQAAEPVAPAGQNRVSSAALGSLGRGQRRCPLHRHPQGAQGSEKRPRTRQRQTPSSHRDRGRWGLARACQ
jgi:8-oxo-dGTP pyrophosphatase MutT (NUDIX family)